MLTLNSSQQFILGEFCLLAWAASVQRANLYDPNLERDERCTENFKRNIFSFINNSLLPSYKSICVESKHLSNIEKLVKYGSKIGISLLGDSGYKLGIAQKLLNLYLKYLWCIGLIPEPPHCPIDRIILNKVGLKVNWTDLTSIDEYKNIISLLKSTAQKESLSIATWELRHYSRR